MHEIIAIAGKSVKLFKGHYTSVGEINYPYLFALLDELGYDGWVGCEDRPRNGTLEGLGWAAQYGIGR